jgi:hypothetical protein
VHTLIFLQVIASSTGSVTLDAPLSYVPAIGASFFFTGPLPSLLLSPTSPLGAWTYAPSTRLLTVMGDPRLLSPLSAAVVPDFLSLDNFGANIVISGISMIRLTHAAVTSYVADNLTISNCSFSQLSTDAVSLVGRASSVLVTGNTVTQSGRGFVANVVGVSSSSAFHVVHNSLTLIGMLAGYGPPGVNGAVGILLGGNGATVANNTLVSESKARSCMSSSGCN